MEQFGKRALSISNLIYIGGSNSKRGLGAFIGLKEANMVNHVAGSISVTGSMENSRPDGIIIRLACFLLFHAKNGPFYNRHLVLCRDAA